MPTRRWPCIRGPRARSAAVPRSGYSNVDLATTTTFTAIVQYQSKIKLLYFQELLTGVNAVRALAGLSAASFNPSATTGSVVYGTQLTGLRSALDAARQSLGLPAVSYAETIVARVTKIKKSQLDEIRGGVQ